MDKIPTQKEMDDFNSYAAKVHILRTAIHENKQVKFNYKTESTDKLLTTKARLINPHAVYVNKKSDTMLDAFQLEGETNSNNEQFKCFVVRNMHNLRLQDTKFVQSKQFNFDSVRYLNAICKIQRIA